jgi:MinD-like ATPase involved in chromosome partitioning or flagellar assembly
VVINRVKGSKQAVEVYERFARVSEQFLKSAPTYMGYINESEDLEKAAIRQTPIWNFSPNSDYVIQIKSLAKAMYKFTLNL